MYPDTGTGDPLSFSDWYMNFDSAVPPGIRYGFVSMSFSTLRSEPGAALAESGGGW